MSFFKTLATAAQLVIPAAIVVAQPAAGINVAAGFLLKHGVKKFPNDLIPVLNFVVSTGVALTRYGTENWQSALMEGATLTAGSTAIHQTVKIPVKELRPGKKSF